VKGTIIRRGSTYSVVLDLGRSPDGRRIRKWHSGYKTKKEAERAQVELLVKIADGAHVEPSKLTVAAFLREHWLPGLRAQVRPGTLAEHKSKVEVHLVPALGGVPLQRLRPGHLNVLYADLLDRGLSARTVLHVHATIRRALADATRWGMVPRNVALLASPPRPAQPELRVWTVAELRAFLGHVESNRLYALWLLASSTGMRRGELLGIQWPDVDLGRARIAVRRSRVTVGHEVVVSEPKTAKGRRSVALDPATVAGLKAWRKHQAAERLAWGPAWTDAGLVFTREDGRPLHPREVTRAFTRLTCSPPEYRSSVCTISGTPTRLWHWRPVSTRRWYRSDSTTRTLPSPWTLTAMPCQRSRRKRPIPWPPWCSASEQVRRA
jgi:integrase